MTLTVSWASSDALRRLEYRVGMNAAVSRGHDCGASVWASEYALPLQQQGRVVFNMLPFRTSVMSSK